MLPRILPTETTKTTLELRDVIAGGVNIWDFEYPSYYKGEEKSAFEQKVVDHFLFREIGAETVGRFLHYFRTTVREIMPYYIQRYKSVELMDDPEIRPLDNYNMIEEFTQTGKETGSTTQTGTDGETVTRHVSGSDQRDTERNVTGSDTQTSTSESTGTTSATIVTENIQSTTENTNTVHAENDTPQGKLSLQMGADGKAILDHASMVSQDNVAKTANQTGSTDETNTASSENSATSTNTGSRTDKETVSDTGSSESSETSERTGNSSMTGATSNDTQTTHKLTRRGNIGVTTYAQLLEGYRQTFLNIDMEIINELDVCFLGVY